MTEKTIGVGIVGYGYMGYFHRCRIMEMEHMKLIGVYDIDENKKDEIAGEDFRFFASFDEMLSDGAISLIVVATPNDLHYGYSMRALAAGKNVLCEKPVMLTLRELQDALDLAAQKGLLFTTHYNRRWDCDFTVVQKVVREGQIGSIWNLYSESYGQRGVCFGWRADPAHGGGMVYDWGIHLIDQLLILFEGKTVTRVNAELRSILTPMVDDYFEIELVFDEDIKAHINLGTFALQTRPRWFLFGDKGTLKIDDFSGTSGGMARIKENIRFMPRVKKNAVTGPSRTMAHLEREDYTDVPLPAPVHEPLAFYRNLEAVLLGRAESAVKPREMLRDMTVIEKVFESSRLQKRLCVEI